MLRAFRTAFLVARICLALRNTSWTDYTHLLGNTPAADPNDRLSPGKRPALLLRCGGSRGTSGTPRIIRLESLAGMLTLCSGVLRDRRPCASANILDEMWDVSSCAPVGICLDPSLRSLRGWLRINYVLWRRRSFDARRFPRQFSSKCRKLEDRASRSDIPGRNDGMRSFALESDSFRRLPGERRNSFSIVGRATNDGFFQIPAPSTAPGYLHDWVRIPAHGGLFRFKLNFSQPGS